MQENRLAQVYFCHRARKIESEKTEAVKKGKKFERKAKKGLTNPIRCGIIGNANRTGAQTLGAIAGVAELADARDLKSRDTKVSYRFDPGHRHHFGRRNSTISRSRAAW